MANKLAKLGTAAFLSVAVIATSVPAMAHEHHRHGRYHQANNYYEDDGYYRNARYEQARYENARYENERYQRGYNNGYRCKPKGTGGLVIGAVVGGLLGREVIGRRGDRTAGAIVGAGAGALAGRALHRAGSNRC
jgi:Glycine zipper 2TM domain